MNRLKFKILPYILVISLIIIIGIGYNNANAETVDYAGATITVEAGGMLNLFGSVGDKVEEDEGEVFGISTRDELWINNDSGVMYLGKDKDVGIKISSGVLLGKLTTAGGWSAFGASTPGDEGWLAYEPIMVTATNEQGYRYAIIVGGSETATSSISNADGTTVLVADGGLVVTGTLDVAGISDLVGTVTLTADMVIGTDLTVTDGMRVGTGSSGGHITALASDSLFVEGEVEVDGEVWFDDAATVATTLTVGGLATFSGNAVVESSLDTVAAGVLNIGTSTATSIEIADAGITTNIQGILTIAQTLDVTGATTLVALTGTGNWLTSGNITGANATFTGSLTVDTNTLIVNASSNFVGIGSTTPSYKLGITGTTAQLALAYDNTGVVTFTVDTADDLTIYPTGGDVDITGTLTVSGTITSTGTLIASGDTTIAGTLAVTGVTTLTDDLIVDTDTLFVDNSGDAVGMGSTTPTWALSITKASAQLALAYNDDGYALFSVSDGDDLTITTSGGDISFGDENVVTTGTFAAGATTISGLTTIGAYDLLVDTDTLFIDSSENNVGMGTSTPQRSLVVDEGITATSSIMIGDIYSGTGKGCLDIASSGGVASRAYLNAAGTGWVVEVGSCE